MRIWVDGVIYGFFLSSLIKVVDELALKLVIPDKSATVTLSSLALMVTKVDGTNFAGMSFSINSLSGIEVKSESYFEYVNVQVTAL